MTPVSLGAFKIQCTNLGSLKSVDSNFLLVNSLHLIVGNVEPSTIILGESVSVSTNFCVLYFYQYVLRIIVVSLIVLCMKIAIYHFFY